MKIYKWQQKRQTNKFGMDAQKKVADFIYWVCDLQRRQETIVYNFCTHSQLLLSVQELEVEVICTKANPFAITVENINVVWG